ncbi:hypothetical protein ACWDUD_01510 [Rhodococcus sp. NPDC003382]
MNGYLTRAEIAKLDAILRTVPWLARQLNITTLRQDRISGAPIPTIVAGPPGVQPLPYNAHARSVADHLHATLVVWVRHVLEQRGMDYHGDSTTAGIARWLRTHIDALALTEDSARALTDIHGATQSAWDAIDRPDENIRPVDPDALERARNRELHASAIEKLARELGDEYRGLTYRRVITLRNAGHFHAQRCVVLTRAEVYRVGDVLDAHLAHPQRRRRARVSTPYR